MSSMGGAAAQSRARARYRARTSGETSESHWEYLLSCSMGLAAPCDRPIIAMRALASPFRRSCPARSVVGPGQADPGAQDIERLPLSGQPVQRNGLGNGQADRLHPSVAGVARPASVSTCSAAALAAHVVASQSMSRCVAMCA